MKKIFIVALTVISMSTSSIYLSASRLGQVIGGAIGGPIGGIVGGFLPFAAGPGAPRAGISPRAQHKVPDRELTQKDIATLKEKLSQSDIEELKEKTGVESLDELEGINIRKEHGITE